MGKHLFAPPARADALWSELAVEVEFDGALVAASNPISFIRALRRRLATPRSSVRRLRTRASCAGGRPDRAVVLRARALPTDRACEDGDDASRNVRPTLRTGRARLMRRLARNAALKEQRPAGGRATQAGGVTGRRGAHIARKVRVEVPLDEAKRRRRESGGETERAALDERAQV